MYLLRQSLQTRHLPTRGLRNIHIPSKLSKIPRPVLIGGAIVGVAVAPSLIIYAIGFGPGGVAAGSIAAGIQSSIGNVAAGSLFAMAQSVGTAPVATTLYTGTGATVGFAAIKLKKLFDKHKEPVDKK